MARLKALFLVGTLKSKSDVSNTRLLSEFLAKHLENKQVQSDIVHLADYNILPGVYTNIDKDDAWPMIFDKILVSDIIIFATPVWWGNQSSLIQRVIERL